MDQDRKRASNVYSDPKEFRPNAQFYFAFTALFVIALAAALSITSISIALPVGCCGVLLNH